MKWRAGAAGLAVLALSAAGCRPEPSAQAQTSTLPRPDLCREVPAAPLRDLLGGPAASCVAGGNAQSGYGAAWTHGATTLTLAYGLRNDVRTGADRWAAVARGTGTRVAVLGLGEAAAFDPSAAPQLAVLSKGLVMTLSITPGPVAVDPVTDLGRAVLTLLAATPPDSSLPPGLGGRDG